MVEFVEWHGKDMDVASVFQSNDQWGFALCFGSPAQTSVTPLWYPDFTPMMALAQGVTWTRDLFPHFGMPLL